MLIINLSGWGLASVFVSAFAVGCWLVVIRIAAYRNRFSNKTYVCLGFQQPIFSNLDTRTSSVVLPSTPTAYKIQQCEDLPTSVVPPPPLYKAVKGRFNLRLKIKQTPHLSQRGSPAHTTARVCCGTIELSSATCSGRKSWYITNTKTNKPIPNR
jgi:hypothetical protein